MAEINKTMFREYDIRGRVDQIGEMTDKAVELIAQSFAVFLYKRNIKRVVIGHDSRGYSPRITEIFIKGLLESGADVIEIGQVLTPILYFAQYHLKEKGAVMITASHNPEGWTGFKLGYDYSVTVLPQEIQELYQTILKDQFIQGKGKREKYKGNIIEDYKKDILSRVNIIKPFKVLVDAGGGTAGPIAPDVLKAAGCEVIEQCCELNSSIHEANPSNLEAIEHLEEGVKNHKTDLGFGYDGDGDRLGVVDDLGRVVWPDQWMILLSRLALKDQPGGKIVFDVKCSESLIEDIKAHGGKPVMWKTGHSYIKQKGKEEKAILAGERSGHVFIFQGYYGYDDALFSSLKLLDYLSRQKKSLSQVMEGIPRYITSPVWHAPCPDEVKYEIIDKLVKEFKEDYGEKKVIDINGARVSFEDGWGLVRASSNVPALVLVFESKTKKGLQRIQNIFQEKFKKFPEIKSRETWYSA